MLFPVSRLIDGKDPPVCVQSTATVREALALMIANDFSQLPILTADRKLVGLISDESIARTYYHLNGKGQLLDIPVVNCQCRPATVDPDDDLFDALDILQQHFAVVVVKDREPVGILTDYDTTLFFRNLAGDLMFVEDIETTLRNAIVSAFPDNTRLTYALVAAFGPDRSSPDLPAKLFDELAFGDHLQVIRTESNWPSFSAQFDPKEIFLELMDGVRRLRNQLTHFRGRLDPVQRDSLERALQWIEPRARLQPVAPSSAAVFDPAQMIRIASSGKGKYARLGDWLHSQPLRVSQIDATFSDLEVVLGEPLPPSAHNHRSWWANDRFSHSQSIAWLGAGWRVREVDLNAEIATFSRTDA